MTRNSVLKSIVLLSAKPIYLTIRDKLSVISQAWFQLGDFEDYRVLEELYLNLSNSPSLLSSPSAQSITNYRELVKIFGTASLAILKCWLLDAKVVVYSERPTLLGQLAYSLAALVPGLLERLRDMPGLKAQLLAQASWPCLQTGFADSAASEDLFPIPFMSQNSLFQPYFPLNDLDALLCSSSPLPPSGFYYTSYFIGTTNRMLAYHLNLKPDMIIDTELCSIEMPNSELGSILKYSERDRMWIDNVKRLFDIALETPGLPDSAVEGYLFKEFRGYYVSLLKTFESSLLSCTRELASSTGSGTELLMNDYGALWFRAWTRSYGFQAWNSQQNFEDSQNGDRLMASFYSDWPSPALFPDEESPEDAEELEPGDELDPCFEESVDGLSETELAIRDAIRTSISSLTDAQSPGLGQTEHGPPYHPGYRAAAKRRPAKTRYKRGMAKKLIGSVSSYLWKRRSAKSTDNEKSADLLTQSICVKAKELEQPALMSTGDLEAKPQDADSRLSGDFEGLERRAKLLRSRLSSNWQHPILSHQPVLASYRDWNYWPARPRPGAPQNKRPEGDRNK